MKRLLLAFALIAIFMPHAFTAEYSAPATLTSLGTQPWTATEKTQALVGSSTVDFAADDTSVYGLMYLASNTGKLVFLGDATNYFIGTEGDHVASGVKLRSYYGWSFLSGGGGANTMKFSDEGNLLIATTTDDGVNKLQVNGPMRLIGGAAPTGTEGGIYFNSTDKHFYGYNGTAWVQIDN